LDRSSASQVGMDDHALDDLDAADRKAFVIVAIVGHLAECPVQPAVLCGFDDNPRLVQAEALDHEPAAKKITPREGNLDFFGLRCRHSLAAGAAGDPDSARDNTWPRQEPVGKRTIHDELASRR